MNTQQNDIRELTAGELDVVTGAGLALKDGSIVVLGYGIEWNSRSICIVTPTQDTIINRPQ